MHKLIRLLALILILLGFQALDAQEKITYGDKVYLKHGSVLVGAITDYNPGESLTIQLKNGNELIIDNAQVKKVVMSKDKSVKGKSVIMPLQENRIYHETQFSFLTNSNGTGYSLGYHILYQKNQLIAFGGGLALDNYYASPGREIIPLYLNSRLTLASTNSAPFVGMKLGYGFAFKREEQNITEAEGGIMANPYFGIRIGSRGMMVNLFTGLKFQKVDYTIQNSWETQREDILHRRLEIGISAMF